MKRRKYVCRQKLKSDESKTRNYDENCKIYLKKRNKVIRIILLHEIRIDY